MKGLKVVCTFTYDFKVPTEPIVTYQSMYQMLLTNQEDIYCPKYPHRFFLNKFTKVMNTTITKVSTLVYLTYMRGQRLVFRKFPPLENLSRVYLPSPFR